MAFWRRKKKSKGSEEPGQAPPENREEENPPQERQPPPGEKEPSRQLPDPEDAPPEGDEPREAEAEAETGTEPPGETEKSGPGLWGRLARRLGRTREKIGGSIERITLGKKIDEEVLDELEEVLVTADLGVPTTLKLIEGLRGRVRRKELDDARALKNALQEGIVDILSRAGEAPRREHDPHVIMVVGVNGVGKTTTIGKLAHHFSQEGRKVLLAAADTFRAAAAEQLEVWARRAGAPLVRGRDGSDPSAVAFDAVEAARARGRDLVIIDTAGRLHTQVNLMEELKKIHRVVGKKLEGAPHEVLLVLDATTGQNAVSQAKLFNQAVPLSGIVLTKLDGTAKGGVVVAIAGEMGLPILYVGLGEKIEDLRPFEPQGFAAAIF